MNVCRPSRLLLQRGGNIVTACSRRRLLPFLSRGRHNLHTTPASFQAFKTTFDLPDPSTPSETLSNFALTKIVSTIGPTSEQAEPLKLCVRAGLNTMRLNFSHATPEEVELRCTNLKAAIAEWKPDVTLPQDVISILLDTKGPELRSGKLANDTSGHDTVELDSGEHVTLHASASTLPDPAGSTATDLLIDFPPLADVLEPGRLVLLDDGAVVLQVVEIMKDKNQILAKVQNSGSLRSRAGVNLPLAETAQYLPALSEKDKADIEYGMKNADIDFVAASFVQNAQHVIDIREHCHAVAAKLPEWKDKPLPMIISKIETASALQHYDEILRASDGIMVARGDLGVEIPLQQVTNAQKEMVAACNAAGKPVIVATQMLESMSKSPRPTRAEVSDVTNAVYDGADCVMTSGETAKGKYPVQTIKFMKEIILSAERYANNEKAMGHPITHEFTDSPKSAISAIAKAAVAASNERKKCTCILVSLDKSTTKPHHKTNKPHPYSLAGLIASHRPKVPIVASCKDAKQARQLQIFRGIHPILTDDNGGLVDAKHLGYVKPGDEAILVQDEGAAAASMQIVKVD